MAKLSVSANAIKELKTTVSCYSGQIKKIWEGKCFSDLEFSRLTLQIFVLLNTSLKWMNNWILYHNIMLYRMSFIYFLTYIFDCMFENMQFLSFWNNYEADYREKVRICIFFILETPLGAKMGSRILSIKSYLFHSCYCTFVRSYK